MVALALMVSCMPSAYTISASEAFGDGTEDIFTDGEITSEPAAEESTPDVSSADQEETEQAQQSTLTYENDSVKVTAEALEDGALPQNTALKADGVNENSSVSYDTVSQKLSAAATDKGSSLRGFFAYDVYFADGDGNRVEPNGRVRVTFEYKTPAAPELTDAASTSVTVEKLHYNNSTGDTDVNTLQANEDLKVLNVNEGKQIQTLQVETGNAAVFAVMWDSPETPAAENPEVTPEAEPSEEPAENPDAEPTEAPAENPDVVEEPAEDIASPDEVPAADENGETSLIEVLGDDTNLRVSPSIEAEVLATVNAGTQLTLLDTVTAEDGATWYKVSWEGTEAYIRSDMAQVVDSSDEAEEPEDVQEEEIQPEITRYDYKSDEVNVKVTLTNPADLPDNAELSVTPVELSQKAEDQITEEAIKEKKAIEKIHAYDIKFLVDGEEIQPGASVKVSVSLNDERKIKDADVYHVDAEDNVENMDGSVDKNGNVEFETTHFSTYVIVQKGKDNIRVKVRYCDQSGKEIYAADDKTLEVANKLKLKELANWNVTRVEVAPTSGGEHKTYTDVETPIELAEDATVTAYYEATTGTTTGDPTFFDYTVKVRTKNGTDSINNSKNYKNPNSDRKLTVGGSDTNGGYSNNYNEYTHVWWDDQNQCPNSWTGYWGDRYKTVKGLLNNVDGPNVTFNYADPGFFEQQNLPVTDQNGNKVYLRRVYKDYKLNFSRTGDTYKLSTVQDGNGERVANAGANFFPLDPVGYQTGGNQANSNVEDINEISTGGGKLHNYFFGLRYDIKFTLGDYIGDLKYKFTGDDDLWVVLDGKTVVIDLGGIHNAATGEVNLWECLLENGQEKVGLRDDQKNKEHILTVLYMERGAEASNCEMEFTLPNATISQVTKDPLGTLELQKVNSNKEGVDGARFTLYGDPDCENKIGDAVSTTVDGVKGKVIFNSKLRAGTYYLKETQAPDGYVGSTETWTVEAKKNPDNTAVLVTLKDSSGKSVENNQIVNQTRQEIIKSSMEYSKTAKVDSWDDRTYNINIKAASTSTSSVTTTTKAVADIMLVLDVSRSMNEQISSETVYTYFADNTAEGRKTLITGTTYYVEVDGSYEAMSYGWIRTDSGWKKDWCIGNEKASNYDSYNYKIYTKKTVTKTRLEALKDSVDQFITDTALKSPESKIGITAFSSNYDQDNSSNGATKELLATGTNKDTLISFANDLKAYGGTTPAIGLNKAKELLDAAANDKNPKYVILFTDGAPTGNRTDGKWDSDAQTNAETSAKALKDARYTVYTIGYGFTDDSNEAKFLAGNGTKNYPGIASPNCAFTANDATKLGEIFRDIQNTITQDIAITGATVTDIIDSRFDLLKDDGTLYTQDDLNNGVEVNGGTVSLVDGCYKIEWTDQTIPNKKKNGEWNKTVKVKAKDSFVGGNNVTTNISPGSKISTGYGDVELPQPTVNVKVNLVVKDKDVWIYKGDTVPTDETILNQLFNESETSYSKGTISAADAKDHITLQWKDGTQTNISKENMATTPDDDTEYYLEVTYDPKTTSTDESKTNTTTSDGEQHVVGAAEKAYNPDNSNNPYGIYKIHVIKGQIQITKNVTETSDTDRTFTFNVNAKNGQNVSDSQVNVIVPAGETSGTVTLPDLPRGEYTVTEDNADGYFIQAFDIVTGDGQTDCENVKSDADKSLKFTLGNDVKKANVITTDYTYTSGGVKGVASYTNEAVISLDLKKTDTDNHSLTGAKFKLEMKDGDIWKSLENDIEVKNDTSEIELNNLKAGIYKLTETTAPKGYSLLGSSICFKVATGSVTLVDENGDPAQKSNMWSLENKVLTIKNAKLYSLPESGGPGIYGFTISGVAILATALLLFINNKRREEEAKRS